MFILEAVIEADPLRSDHPCGVSEAAQLCGLAQRCVNVLAPVEGWTARLVKVESGGHVRVLDVRPDVVANAKRERPDPAAVRVARELLAVREKGVLFIEPAPIAIAEGIILSHELAAAGDQERVPDTLAAIDALDDEIALEQASDRERRF
jgi:hypothetical protein